MSCILLFLLYLLPSIDFEIKAKLRLISLGLISKWSPYAILPLLLSLPQCCHCHHAAISPSCHFPKLPLPQCCHFPMLPLPHAATSQCCHFPMLPLTHAATDPCYHFPMLPLPQCCPLPHADTAPNAATMHVLPLLVLLLLLLLPYCFRNGFRQSILFDLFIAFSKKF